MLGDKTFLPKDLCRYFRSVSVREPSILRKLREETDRLPLGRLQSPPEHAQFIALLNQMIGARRMLEVGVFTGYTSLTVALGLPPDGQVVGCEANVDFAAIARRYWRAAKVEHMMDLRMGVALDALRGLIAEGQQGTFDFAFIDADKAPLDAYYECALELVRVGGIVAIDNVLWHGRVSDPYVNDSDTTTIRALNKKIHEDARVSISMVPISDGLTLCLKR